MKHTGPCPRSIVHTCVSCVALVSGLCSKVNLFARTSFSSSSEQGSTCRTQTTSGQTVFLSVPCTFLAGVCFPSPCRSTKSIHTCVWLCPACTAHRVITFSTRPVSCVLLASNLGVECRALAAKALFQAVAPRAIPCFLTVAPLNAGTCLLATEVFSQFLCFPGC